MNVYPVLRHLALTRLKSDNSDLVFNIEVPHLIVGAILPENSKEVEANFNSINLRPYELCVKSFFNGDFKYDISQVKEPEQKTFVGIPQVIDDLNSLGTNFPIIIAYLQFPNP